MNALSGIIEHFTYFAIVTLLVVAGVGVPVPEEAVLLSAGLLSSHGTLEFWKAAAACWLGVVAGDFALYLIGARLGPRVLMRSWFRKLFTPRIVKWIDERFRRHGAFTVVLGRFAAPLRAPVYLMAGIAGMKPWKFLAADAPSAVVSVGITVWGADRFGSLLPRILADVGEIRHILAAAVLGLGIVVALVVLRRRARREREGVTRAAARQVAASVGRLPTLQQA